MPEVGSKIYEVTVKPGYRLDRIAKTQGSTRELLGRMNPSAGILQPGMVLKYQKASTPPTRPETCGRPVVSPGVGGAKKRTESNGAAGRPSRA